MNFKPLHDRIAVEVIEQSTKTTSGLILPDSTKEKPVQGKVIAVGQGYRNENGSHTPLEVKVGQVVLFGKWAGTEVKVENKEYLIMKESDILGIIENFKQ